MPGPKRGNRTKTTKEKMAMPGGNGKKKPMPKKPAEKPKKKPAKTKTAMMGGNGKAKKKSGSRYG